MRIMIVASALCTVALSAAVASMPPAAGPVQTSANAVTDWTIGPAIRGRNYSQGMPLHPTMGRSGPYFDFPYPSADAGHVHYITQNIGPIPNARAISLRYRIDAAPGTRFVPQEYPDRDAILSLYIQRRGDNWLAKGDYQFYRWYSPTARVVDLEPGVHVLTINMDENWVPVLGGTSQQYPEAFRDALAHADKVGFVMGSAGGRGHGVFAPAPARFTVLDFSVR